MNLQQLINLGYTADNIIDAFSNGNPKIGRKLSKARRWGYSAATILNMLSGGGKDDEEYTTLEQKSKGLDRKRNNTQNMIAGGALALGALGAGALGARSGAAALARQAAQQAIPAGIGPNPPGGGNPPVPPAQLGALIPPTQQQGPQPPNNPPALPGMQPIQGGQAPITPAQTNIINQIHGMPKPGSGKDIQALQPPQTESPPLDGEILQQEVEKPFDYYKTKTAKNHPYLEKFIATHKDLGKSPEETHQILGKSKLLSPLIKRFEEETGKPITQAIESIYGKSPQKDQLVMTPIGAGEVHKTHGKDAFVETDKGLKKFPASELKPPPPDVVQAVSDILKIPEIDRSSNVALFLYDPSESKAIFQFHSGDAYKYLNIDPEVVRMIAEKEATPITQGQNVYGAWSPDDKHGSLGAALYAYVLKDPKYAKTKKGEPANPNYMKLQTLYDYWTGLRKKRK